jgi:CzcA family heavy metal efflux pump
VIRAIVTWSLSFRLVVIPAAAALLVFGVIHLRDAPVDVLPEFSPTYVEVQTEALGLSASEVEELITVPLERDLLNGVAGVDAIRSESVLGLSSVTLVFEPGTDLLDARQLVQERLIQAHILPNVAKPPTMLQPLSAQSRVLMIGLSSNELSPTELGLLARWTIRPRLLGVAGVANVVIWGQREHQLHVQVDPKRLRENGVTLQQVISTTGNAQLVSPLSFLEASTPGTGGFIDTPNQRLQVRHILPIAQASGLADVALDGADGRRMRLGDVADVVEDHQPLIGDAIVDGRPGLLLVVEKFPDTSTLEVTRNVEEALDAIRPGLSGVEVDSAVFRPATFIETALENLAIAVIVGLLLLALVLVAFFLEWRAAVISLVSVPLALVAAALVLSLRGETLNAVAFAGLLLAAGVVVDDAIVGVERVRRKTVKARGSIMSAVVEATLEVRASLLYGALIALVAVVPVFFLDGRTGAFFEPLAVSWVLAVLASTVVALAVTPALCLVLLRRAALSPDEHPLLRRATPRYRIALSSLLSRPLPALAAAGGIGLLALALTPLLGQSVIPTFKERELLIRLNGAPGTSRPAMVRIATQVGRELQAIRGVRNVGAHVGRAVMGDQLVGANAGALWVSIDPDAGYDGTVDRIREVIAGYPGLERELITYSEERLRAVGAVEEGSVDTGSGSVDGLTALRGSGQPVVVRIYGKELPALRTKADEVRDLLLDIDGVVDPSVEPRVDEPTLEIEPNLAAARRHGIKPGDIHRAAATLVQGIEVGSLFEEQKVFEVVVRGVPEIRHSPDGIRRLIIDRPGGGQVQLSDVADVRVTANPTVIRREAASRRIDVTAGVRGRDLDDVLDDVEANLARIDFPLEYHAEVLTDSSERRGADRRFLSFALAAGIATFLLLQAALGSWRLALLFFGLLPFALLGGVVAALIDGRRLTLGALAGFLLLLTIAVRHSLLLIHRYRRLQGDGAANATNLVLQGAQEHVGSILTTALAIVATLLPFLVLGDIAGYEIAHPLAAVVLGGLVTTTLFVLFVVPALFALFGPTDRLAAEADLTEETA